MARVIWMKKNDRSNSTSNEAKVVLDNLEKAMQDSFHGTSSKDGGYGFLDSALSHWEANRCELSQAMNTMSVPDSLLETVFSFQNDHVQIFINVEGAKESDVSVVSNREEGGFEVQVVHNQSRRPAAAKQAAFRRVSRSYRLLRPCFWDRMEHSITRDGILQIIVPGPLLVPHHIPISSPLC